MLERSMILPHLLAERANSDPDRLFLEEVDGISATYSQLHHEVLTWADGYRKIGVSAGDTVLVMLPTSIEATSAWLGLSWLRAIEVPVNTGYRGEMLRYLIEHSKARTMVLSACYLPQIAELNLLPSTLSTLIVPDLTEPSPELPYRILSREEFLSDARPCNDLPGPEIFDIATIMYTSGTTGPSKGVMMPWAQMYKTATADIFIGDFTPEDAYYLPFPLFHISGKGPIYTFLITGGRVVLKESFRTDEFWPDIDRYRCTTTLLLGAMANFLYRKPPSRDDHDTPLHTVVMVPLIPEFHDFGDRFGVRVSTAFNMTEISCPLTSGGWSPPNTTSCGQLREGFELRIVDEFDETLPPGEVGELIVRADDPWTLMLGYFDDPEATNRAWRNGWVHTGDAFRCDDDGNYYFVERLKDSIRRRGENISSAEVEAIVGQHPDVVECAAIAVPSEWGEDDVMVVVVLQNKTQLEPLELFGYLVPRMPRFMLPRYIDIAQSLPKTPTEKVRKVELREAGVSATTWDRDAEELDLPVY
jgi:crotonobetaine/carnitine-CoA ligase